MTLIAVAAVGLTAAGCSLQVPGGPGTYSALLPETASVARTPIDRAVEAAAAPSAASDQPAPPPAVAALPDGFVLDPAQPPMPGDLKRIAEPPGGGRTEPVAALNASARARSQWEALHPDELNRVPSLSQRLGNLAASGTPAATTGTTNQNYDREAAMQNLMKGGRTAGGGICSGC